VKSKISNVIVQQIAGGYSIRVQLKKPNRKESKIWRTIFCFYCKEDFWPFDREIRLFSCSIIGLTIEEFNFFRFSCEWDRYISSFD
jgi:hypothetical protein